ncbi:hypothetical protein [Bacteroides uniformis]|uniref:hypothetical protein n=2 Tax=Bacteroides uniformis TaxID=820 RepID=UPI003D7C1FB5
MEEQIRKFLSICSGYGSGDGYGDGSGYGSGDGYGDGYGDGSGDGSGYGYGAGYGDGSGYGSGSGDGSGYGSGSGYGYGSGSGDGYGDGSGIKTFNGDKVYIIDDIPTIIKHVHDNVAKGYILNDDFTLTETFVAKGNGKFAHGETLHEAFASLQEKLYDDSTEEERLEAFKKHFPDFTKKVSAKELFHWHHVLTGSCKQGRLSFCTNKGIDIDNDTYTVHEFIELTQDSYGGDIIRKLK